MWRSTAPMVTLSKPFSMTQLPSHRRSCGQMRPQISGKLLVAELTSYASSSRPSAVSFSQSGMLFDSGQWIEQNGMPHWLHRLACARPRPGRTAVDLVEILAALRHGTLLGRLLRQADELQHAVGHRVCLPKSAERI